MFKKIVTAIGLLLAIVGGVLLFTMNSSPPPQVKVIEKENIINKNTYKTYTNSSFIKDITSVEHILSGIFTLRNTIDVPSVKNSLAYKDYYSKNSLGIQLIKYLEKQKGVMIDTISYDEILNLQDENHKIGKFIDRDAVFEIPLSILPLSYTEDFQKDDDIYLKFNFPLSTISIKKKNEEEKEFEITFNGSIDLERFYGEYVFKTYYYHSNKDSQGFIFIKTIDSKRKIGYHILSVTYTEEGEIESIYANDNALRSLFFEARKSCVQENVVKEYIYPSQKGNLILTCITGNKTLYSHPLYF